MTVKEYVLRRIDQGETDLTVLARQTRIQFPSWNISFNCLRPLAPCARAQALITTKAQLGETAAAAIMARSERRPTDTLLLKAHAQVTIWPTSTTPAAWFAMDSLLEGDGFEPSVPRHHGRRFRDTTFVGLKHLAAMRRRMRNSTPEHRYHNVPKTAGPDCQLASSIVGAGIAGAGQRAARRFLKFR